MQILKFRIVEHYHRSQSWIYWNWWNAFFFLQTNKKNQFAYRQMKTKEEKLITPQTSNSSTDEHKKVLTAFCYDRLEEWWICADHHFFYMWWRQCLFLYSYFFHLFYSFIVGCSIVNRELLQLIWLFAYCKYSGRSEQ